MKSSSSKIYEYKFIVRAPEPSPDQTKNDDNNSPSPPSSSTPNVHSTNKSVNPNTHDDSTTVDIPSPIMNQFYTPEIYIPRKTSFDINRFNETLQLFVGTHNFNAFAGQINQSNKKNAKRLELSGYDGECEKINTIRTVYNITVVATPASDDFTLVTLRIHLNGALYKMIRNIVGAAVDVLVGKLNNFDILRLLEDGCGREENKSKPVDGKGLRLIKVLYDGYC